MSDTGFKKIEDDPWQEGIVNNDDNEYYVDGVRYQESNLRPRKQLYKPKEPENMSDMWENDFVSRIFDLMGSYDNFVSGDLTKLSTYGVVKRDNVDSIVLIDYGLTDEVYNTHYKR